MKYRETVSPIIIYFIRPRQIRKIYHVIISAYYKGLSMATENMTYIYLTGCHFFDQIIDSCITTVLRFVIPVKTGIQSFYINSSPPEFTPYSDTGRGRRLDSPVSSTGQAQVKCGMTTGKDNKGFLSLPPACRQAGLSGVLP